MVHIKKVDLFGFKSFGFKTTTVNFEPGLVSISGPNGSGKSNILDAIIFAMGENKSRTMRAPTLRALMHDIDGNRHGPKITRVRLQFDNSDRKIPIDSDIVTITREMNDKGESNYYIDTKKANRGRILDLFEVANAGLNKLNAVQQGTVTRISEMNDEEKRKTIEDLIGLSYFDEKKAESIKQLTEADQRLEIAMAKMGEVKKHIDELETERNLKLRHELIGQEIDRYKAINAASRLKIIKNEKISKEQIFNSNQTEVENLDKTHANLKQKINKLDAQKSDFLGEMKAYNQAKSTIDVKLSAEQQKFDGAESKIKTSQKRIAQIDKRLPEITSELEQMNQNHGVIDSELEEVKKTIHTINEQKKATDKKIWRVDSELKSALEHQSLVASKKNEIDAKIQDLRKKLHDVHVSKSQIESQQKNTQNKIDSNIAKKKNVIDELTKLKQFTHTLSKISSVRQSTSSKIKSENSKLSQQRTKIEDDIAELELILERSSNAANRYNEKIKLVKGVMHEDYTISQLRIDANKLGIEGLVYELLSWNKQYERAILAVSSDWIKAMVVPDFETLVSLSQVARDKKLPKLKIIPLNAIPEFHMKMPQTSDLLGILSDHVKCDRKHQPIARFLFGNVILTKTRQVAQKLSKDGYRAVSIDGEFFESKNSAAIIDINSKISKLTKIISQSSSVEGLFQSIDILRKHIQKKKSNLKKIGQREHHYMKQIQISETEASTASYSNSSLNSKIKSTSNLHYKLSGRILELETEKKRLDTKLIQILSSIESFEQRISLVKENYSAPEQARVANEITLVNEKKALLISEQSKIMHELTEMKGTISEIENKKKFKERAFLQERSSMNNEKNELETIITEFQTAKNASEQNLILLREKEQELISTSGTSVSQLSEFDGKLREMNDEERNISNHISRLVRESDGLRRDLGEIKEKESSLVKILTSFGFDESIETFDVVTLIEPLEKEQNSLSSSLNAIAPQRYVEISTGYRSMSTRKNELEEERNCIYSFIESIEKDKKQTFLDAFDIVDKEIRKIFSKMNGGNAWLELENEDDIFNSGVSYFIQFQNKPKRESTSISGGEKTLAAVVFVLALQKLKPSPFYLFDEIDAHLDAPNAESLSKIIEERSNGSQFIMVSLKDSVVEKAKLIYGVYPKNGVSNVITYKDKTVLSITG